MSLDRAKLQKVRDLDGGGLKAQCPACAEAGQDRKGEHLRISPDGKFGCCVFPGDREHRRRIFALAGGSGEPRQIKVRVAESKAAEPLQLDLLGRLGQVFESPSEIQGNEPINFGTFGTTTYSLRVSEENNSIYRLIEFAEPVPSVPKQQETSIAVVGVLLGAVQLPYLTASGDLVIPFDSPERYHWWKGGQSIRDTRRECEERKENDASPF